jgi:hypothetical protein
MTFAEQVLTILFISCSVVVWMNVRALIRDKCTKGCSISPVFVFLFTNAYEVWYFTHFHQPVAALGAASMVGANLIWIALAFWYRYQARDQDLLDSVS